MLFVFTTTFVFSEKNKVETQDYLSSINYTHSRQSNFMGKYKKIEITGKIFLIDKLINKSTEKVLILEDDNSDTIYEFDKNQKKYKTYLEEYRNYRVAIKGTYYSTIFKNSKGEIDEKRLLIVEIIEIKYTDIEVVGSVSLRGRPSILILKESDSDTSYEFDKKQENYKLYVKEYQGYKVKIIGKYYSKHFKYKKNTEIERRYLIVETIEKIGTNY